MSENTVIYGPKFPTIFDIRGTNDFLMVMNSTQIFRGVYRIVNPKNRVYIGQSTNIRKRWNCYKRLKCEGQKLLFKSLKKYGVENHLFQIVTISSLSCLDDAEEMWGIAHDSLNPEKGLNSSLRKTRQIFSEETRKKISDKRKLQILPQHTLDALKEASRRQVYTPERNKKISIGNKGKKSWCKGLKLSDSQMDARFKNQYKSVNQYSKDGTFIKNWKSIVEASRALGIKNRGNISAACNGIISKTARGYIWKYAN